MTTDLDLALKPSEHAPAGFPLLENHVRARLGISRDEMLLIRKTRLAEGVDWCLRKKRVWLAQAGVAKTAAAKGVAAPVSGCLDAQRADAARDGGVAEAAGKKVAEEKGGAAALVMVRTCVNPHIVLACPEGDDYLRPKKTVRVRVRSNANFRRGMALPGILVAGYEDLFDLGRACPKKPGKW